MLDLEEKHKKGGYRPNAGRPKGAKNKTIKADELKRKNRIVLLCTEDESVKLKELAKEAGLPLSAYILGRLFDR